MGSDALPEQAGLFAAGAAPSRAALQAAHARLLQEKGLQFDFAAAQPPKPAHEPAWLKALGQVIEWMAHMLGWVFWAAVALGAALLVIFIVSEIVRARWPERFRRKAKPKPPPLDWRPDAAVARALLAEADALAAAGRYGEAARLILHRSIEDIDGRRPHLVRPANTAREIAGMDALPAAARATFAFIASTVERSLFGGRDLDASGFDACRKAYEDFALPGAWA